MGRNSPLGKVGDQNSKLGATIRSWGLTIKEGKLHPKIGLTSKGLDWTKEEYMKE